MVKITFTTNNGEVYDSYGDVGSTVMEIAVRNSIPGIPAECGGACTCATCHVYVDTKWLDIVGKPEDMEAEMLDFANHVQRNSRLSCQIRVATDFDGLMLQVPPS